MIISDETSKKKEEMNQHKILQMVKNCLFPILSRSIVPRTFDDPMIKIAVVNLKK